jgi:hypothetical protein
MHYTGHCDSNKLIFNISATIDEINAYSEKVRRNDNPFPVCSCPKCHAKSDFFIPHDKKTRKFRVIIDQVVQIAIGLLTLWKCPECGKCFMGYPPFAMPYKRYTVPTIRAFSQWYVEEDAMTYRRLVDETPILSSTSPEWELSHSTIHRWIRTLGQMNQTVAIAQDLVLQKDPASTICRDLAGLTIPARKYVRETRKNLLLTCRRLVRIEKQFFSRFHVTIFHQLATACSYG